MKQTKPFGHSGMPAAAPPAAAPADPGAHAPDSSATSALQLALAGPGLSGQLPGADLFSLRAAHAPTAPARKPYNWKYLVRDSVVVAWVMCGLMAGFVAMRDSMMLANFLAQISTEETIMVCKDGKVLYTGFGVIERLRNQGHFVCTDWRVQSGYLTIPRH